MPDVIDDLLRLALCEAWGERCVWCGRPLRFNEMEVEHLIPKSLPPAQRPDVFKSQGVGENFDLEAVEKLGPSCGPCNRGKGKRPPPEAPVSATLLRSAAEKAAGIRATAETLRGRRQVTRAAVLREAARAGDEAAIAALQTAAVGYRPHADVGLGTEALHAPGPRERCNR